MSIFPQMDARLERRILEELKRRNMLSTDGITTVFGKPAIRQGEPGPEALADAAEVIAVYGKIMNLVSQSTSFKVAPKTPKAVKSSFVVEQDDLSRLQPMTEATNITKLVKYINDTFADKEMHNLTTVELGRWLENTGYLQLPEDGRNKIPTEKGSALGIVTEKRVRQATGEIYYINLYPQAAQQFIFANLPAVAEFLAKEKEEKLADA